MMTAVQKLKVPNKLGLHARVAALIVKEANRYQACLEVKKGTQIANAKSIMDILTLAATKGSAITIRARGSDAKEAVEAIAKLFESRFGENE